MPQYDKWILRMLLDLDKRNPEAIAAIDSYGGRITYGDLLSLAEKIQETVGYRSLFLCSQKTMSEVLRG